jgi:hypothetical protein
MALAISFVGAPLKFRAPEVTTRIGFANRSVVYRGGAGMFDPRPAPCAAVAADARRHMYPDPLAPTGSGDRECDAGRAAMTMTLNFLAGAVAPAETALARQ